MSHPDFRYEFDTSQSPTEVFSHLVDPNNWWVGLFGETIEGTSRGLDDEFSFRAGGGVHFSNQRLIGIEPNRSIVWLVTESNLSFLNHTNEWTGTKIRFDIQREDNVTKVVFSHVGLNPGFECYESCSNGWTQYLQKLKSYFS